MYWRGCWRRLLGRLGRRTFFVCWRLACNCMAEPGNCWGSRQMLREFLRARWHRRFHSRGENWRRSCGRVDEELITRSAEETVAWGRALAQRLTAPVLVLLSGGGWGGGGQPNQGERG